MIISIILFALAVVFYSLSQIRVFEESDDWQNKYKKPLENAPKTWYYRLTGVKFKEKFPLSATLLVSFTDSYHRHQAIFKILFCASIIFYKPWLGILDIAVFWVTWGIVFTIVQRFK